MTADLSRLARVDVLALWRVHKSDRAVGEVLGVSLDVARKLRRKHHVKPMRKYSQRNLSRFCNGEFNYCLGGCGARVKYGKCPACKRAERMRDTWNETLELQCQIANGGE